MTSACVDAFEWLKRITNSNNELPVLKNRETRSFLVGPDSMYVSANFRFFVELNQIDKSDV